MESEFLGSPEKKYELQSHKIAKDLKPILKFLDEVVDCEKEDLETHK